jgi:hypothetical protein
VLLPGVWHLPGRRPWYGSASVVPLWAAYLAGDATARGPERGAERGLSVPSAASEAP